MQELTDAKRCKLASCGREFKPPADAPHKVFCSTVCRNSWHRAKGLAERGKVKALKDLGLLRVSDSEVEGLV